MKFRKTKSEPTLIDGEPFNPEKMRNLIFETLAKRVGESNAAYMKADFLHHIADDGEHGLELAYMCLLGKMVDTVDKVSDMLNEATGFRGGQGTLSPFTMFRKDG